MYPSFHGPYRGPSTVLPVWSWKFMGHPLSFPAFLASPQSRYSYQYATQKTWHGSQSLVSHHTSKCICHSCFRSSRRIHLLSSKTLCEMMSCNASKMDQWYQGKGCPVNYFNIGIFLHPGCNMFYLNNLLEQQW